MHVPFNRPFRSGTELEAIRNVLDRGKLSGGGPETEACQQLLQDLTGSPKVLLANSCTAALEMSALLSEIGPTHEVIMPSFTFVSSANAFVLRGATPVFVDIRSDTFNIDENQIEAAITERTAAILVVHYAGVGCEMDAIGEIAKKHNLIIIEDAAQAIDATYKRQPLGSFGALSAFSFHETKNIQCGEGGALCINELGLADRAEILWEKGTNRSRFLRGMVDKYTWVDVGSSFLPSEITAAMLHQQLLLHSQVTESRKHIWNRYFEGLAELELEGLIRRPMVPPECVHCAHMFPILASDSESQSAYLHGLTGRGIQAVFHYVPLHSSPAGRRFGRSAELPVTDDVAARLIRLPLWAGMSTAQVDYVIRCLAEIAKA